MRSRTPLGQGQVRWQTEGASALRVISAILLLAGCAPMSGSIYSDGRFTYSNAKTSMDWAGGPRQDILVIVDRDGSIVQVAVANGSGTLQSVAGALLPAAGQAASGVLIRPARNTTNVSMDVQGTGGSGGAGGSNVTTATSSATGGQATGGSIVR